MTGNALHGRHYAIAESPDALTVVTAETPACQVGVKVSYFGGIGFGRVGSPDTLFGKAFQPSESLKALTWFEGGDLGSLGTEDRNLLIQAARGVRDLPQRAFVASTLGLPA